MSTVYRYVMTEKYSVAQGKLIAQLDHPCVVLQFKTGDWYHGWRVTPFIAVGQHEYKKTELRKLVDHRSKLHYLENQVFVNNIGVQTYLDSYMGTKLDDGIVREIHRNATRLIRDIQRHNEAEAELLEAHRQSLAQQTKNLYDNRTETGKHYLSQARSDHPASERAGRDGKRRRKSDS